MMPRRLVTTCKRVNRKWTRLFSTLANLCIFIVDQETHSSGMINLALIINTACGVLTWCCGINATKWTEYRIYVQCTYAECNVDWRIMWLLCAVRIAWQYEFMDDQMVGQCAINFYGHFECIVDMREIQCSQWENHFLQGFRLAIVRYLKWYHIKLLSVVFTFGTNIF